MHLPGCVWRMFSTRPPCWHTALPVEHFFYYGHRAHETFEPLTGQVAVVTGAGTWHWRRHRPQTRRPRRHRRSIWHGLMRRSTPRREQSSMPEAEPEVITWDVTILHQLQRAATRVDSTFDAFDILVNDAGVATSTTLSTIFCPKNSDRILNTNLPRRLFHRGGVPHHHDPVSSTATSSTSRP